MSKGCDRLEVIDYTEQISALIDRLNGIDELLKGIASLLIVFLIILLCHYVYKFFKMFF